MGDVFYKRHDRSDDHDRHGKDRAGEVLPMWTDVNRKLLARIEGLFWVTHGGASAVLSRGLAGAQAPNRAYWR